MESIDLFLKLMEKIISFLKERKHNKKQLFDNFVDPLFQDLDGLIEDYFLLFRKAHKLLNEPSINDTLGPLAEIQKHREQLWHVRRRCETFAEAVTAEIDDERYIKFASQIVRLFQAPDYANRDGRTMSKSSAVVGFLQSMDRGKISKHEAQDKLKHIELEVQDSWVAICTSYANLKIYALS